MNDSLSNVRKSPTTYTNELMILLRPKHATNSVCTFSLYIHTIYLINRIVYVLPLHTRTYVWVKYDLILKRKYMSSNTRGRVLLHTRMSYACITSKNMNVYMNHHVTRMNACVTNVHMNECYRSQIPSLSRSTCAGI